MKNLHLRVAEKEDYKALAEWLVQISQRSERHCLHTWSGETATGLEQQWLAYLEDGELCYTLAMREGELVGAMGSEYDEELGRGWLHGPHAEEENWEAISDELFKLLLLELPEGIKQFTAYLNVENRRGRGFYTRQGFKEGDDLNYDFWLVPEEGASQSSAGVSLLKEKHQDSTRSFTKNYSPKRITPPSG